MGEASACMTDTQRFGVRMMERKVCVRMDERKRFAVTMVVC